MPARVTRTPRLAPEIRRRQIIDATLRVAEKSGFSELTVDAIAAAAGITRPVVYDLFGDLKGLLAATLEDAMQRAMAAVDSAIPAEIPSAPPEDVLTAALLTFLEAVRAVTTTPDLGVSGADAGPIPSLPVTPSLPSVPELPVPTPSIVAPSPPAVTVPDVSVPSLQLPQP